MDNLNNNNNRPPLWCAGARAPRAIQAVLATVGGVRHWRTLGGGRILAITGTGAVVLRRATGAILALGGPASCHGADRWVAS